MRCSWSATGTTRRPRCRATLRHRRPGTGTRPRRFGGPEPRPARQRCSPSASPSRCCCWRVNKGGRVRPASRGGGPECTASGVPREAFQPGDLAFPQISAPALPARPLFAPSRNTASSRKRRERLSERTPARWGRWSSEGRSKGCVTWTSRRRSCSTTPTWTRSTASASTCWHHPSVPIQLKAERGRQLGRGRWQEEEAEAPQPHPRPATATARRHQMVAQPRAGGGRPASRGRPAGPGARARARPAARSSSKAQPNAGPQSASGAAGVSAGEGRRQVGGAGLTWRGTRTR